MLELQTMTEYNEWLLTEGVALGKYGMKFISVESVEERFLVCGTPMAIEPVLESSGYALLENWNKMMHENEEYDIDIDEEDPDGIAMMRDKAYEVIELLFGIEIVFVSTEY